MSKLKATPVMANPTMVIDKGIGKEPFSNYFTEAVEDFNARGVSVIHDVNGVITNEDIYSSYKNKLLAHVGNANISEELSQLMDNTRMSLLMESSINNITPIAGLAFPVNYRLWAKTAIIKGFPTQVVNVPSFSLAIMKPYIMDAAGNKKYLPNAIVENPEMVDMPPLDPSYHPLTQLVNYDLLSNTLINGVPCSVVNRDAIDPKISIQKVKMEITPEGETQATTVVVNTNIEADRRGIFRGKVFAKIDDVDYSDTLFGDIDFQTGIVNVLCVNGLIKEVSFRGYISQETNLHTNSVGFDTDVKEVRVTGGPHLNAPITSEFIQDTMALYNIDALLEMTNILSMVAARRLDQRLDRFVNDSYVANGFDVNFNGKFNVKPGQGMIQLPTEWRKELRTVIEWWASKVKQMTFFREGHFFCYGNTMDIQLIPDISWSLGETKREVGGVAVDNDFGVFTNNNNFHFAQGDDIKEGSIRMIYCPDSDKHHTYLYCPYSFNLERNTYRDPNNSLVPNIVMIKRDTMLEVFPIQARIDILGNDGSNLATYF